jgi:pimeloyl-ACP methyl ester carboxylesterase
MDPRPGAPETVLLLHGIWLVGSTLRLLARRLAAAGFEPVPLTYPSVTGGPAVAAARVRDLIRARGRIEPVHLVGHSLGGFVALEAVREADDLPPGRIVCLGSPLAGSDAARRLARISVARPLIGRSAEALCHGLRACPAGREVGSIAGRLPLGLGAVIAGFREPHDGTVALSETRLPGLVDHCVVPASHTGLLLSPEAARRTIEFLRSGRFAPAPPRDGR